MNKVFSFQFDLVEENKSLFSKDLVTELFFDEHLEEIRQRLFQSLFFLLLNVVVAFFNSEKVVQILQAPVPHLKFFQTSPGEYFVSTLQISFYTGLMCSIPGLLSQLIFFLLPGLNKKEKKLSLGLVISSCGLFFLGLSFSYFTLVPAALNFFISYAAASLEPLWSFEKYFGFVLVLFLSTGLVFQIPIVQVVLSFAQIVTGPKMLSLWKYVLLVATILGAILTPSADPLTQVLLSMAVFFLYLIGCFFATSFSRFMWTD